MPGQIARRSVFELGAWFLFGAWILEFGVCCPCSLTWFWRFVTVGTHESVVCSLRADFCLCSGLSVHESGASGLSSGRGLGLRISRRVQMGSPARQRPTRCRARRFRQQRLLYGLQSRSPHGQSLAAFRLRSEGPISLGPLLRGGPPGRTG